MKDVKQENSDPLSDLIEQVFRRCGSDLGIVKAHARNFARLIEKADPFIQKSTEAVCPECRQVCCINRHSYHTHFDVLYLEALGIRTPPYETGIRIPVSFFPRGAAGWAVSSDLTGAPGISAPLCWNIYVILPCANTVPSYPAWKRSPGKENFF